MEDEVKEILLNGMEIPFFIAMLLLAFAGVIVFFIREVIKGIKCDMNTPNKFDFKTLIKMSLLRMGLGVILIPISIIFFGELSVIIFQIEEPLEINGMVAFMMGMSIDRLVDGIVGGSKDSIQYFKSKF